MAKDGLEVPVFLSGKMSHSKYSPEKEADRFAENTKYSSLFLVLGLSGGYHIDALSKKYPSSKILVLENSKDDIDFLMKNVRSITEVSKNENVKIFEKKDIEKVLLENYLPTLYPTFSVLGLQSWEGEMKDEIQKIREKIKHTISEISADFATQARFGKIWQNNIMKNIFSTSDVSISLPTKKTAVIVAAGSSLNKTISYIKKNRKNIFVIATDTAFLLMKKRKITADAVVSLDAQNISHNHFMTQFEKETIFVLDIAVSPCIVRKIKKNGNKIIFSFSGHPLAAFIENENGKNSFFHLDSGSGTVTISAVDFAKKAGFEKIVVLGADFAYIDGACYAEGTYLDDIFQKKQNRIIPFETQFSLLMFRSALKSVSKNKKTTELLDSYRKSFENWAKNNGYKVFFENDVYSLEKCEHGDRDFAKIYDKNFTVTQQQDSRGDSTENSEQNLAVTQQKNSTTDSTENYDHISIRLSNESLLNDRNARRDTTENYEQNLAVTQQQDSTTDSTEKIVHLYQVDAEKCTASVRSLKETDKPMLPYLAFLKMRTM